MTDKQKEAAQRLVSTWRLSGNAGWAEVRWDDLRILMEAMITEEQLKEGRLWISVPPVTSH